VLPLVLCCIWNSLVQIRGEEPQTVRPFSSSRHHVTNMNIQYVMSEIVATCNLCSEVVFCTFVEVENVYLCNGAWRMLTVLFCEWLCCLEFNIFIEIFGGGLCNWIGRNSSPSKLFIKADTLRVMSYTKRLGMATALHFIPLGNSMAKYTKKYMYTKTFLWGQRTVNSCV